MFQRLRPVRVRRSMYPLLSLLKTMAATLSFMQTFLKSPSTGKSSEDDDGVGLHVLGCRVDILGTNCKT